MQRLFSANYLFEEVNIALNFLLLEDGVKFLVDRSIQIQFSKLNIPLYDVLKFNFSHFTPHIRLIFVKKGKLKFSDSTMCQ